MEIRSISPDEFRAYASVWERTFNFDGKDEELEVEAKHHELDRSIVAIDDESFVGTGGAFSFDMTVPGGSVPAAGLTAIAVLPTKLLSGTAGAIDPTVLDEAVLAAEQDVGNFRVIGRSDMDAVFGYEKQKDRKS